MTGVRKYSRSGFLCPSPGNLPFLLDEWRRFLVPATTIVCHGETSFTIGIPFARVSAGQDDWEHVPESFCRAVLTRRPGWALSIRRHKAEEVVLGTTVFLSQTCRSWRPEVCLSSQDGLMITTYWGMGLKRQSKWIDGMVVRVRSADALWQCLDVLDNGSPMFPDLMDFILMRILQKFGPFGCVSSIQD